MGPYDRLFLASKFSLPALFMSGINAMQLTVAYEFILLEMQKTHKISSKDYHTGSWNHRL